MTHAARWPDLPADQVLARVTDAWDLTTGWPLPRFPLVCPVCGYDDVGLKDWRFFERKHATVPHRCDVTAKCTSCSHVLTFGLAVPTDVYEQHQPGRTYRWRTVRRELAERESKAAGGPVGLSPRAD